jgi:oligopeptide/dipeptide ABC transporter ATP-binding protein
MSAAADGIVFDQVRRSFGSGDALIHAVDGVSFSLGPGEIVSLVGESGCGKSTAARIAAGLMSPSEGRLLWNGRDVAGFSRDELSRFRLAVQLIHQDPYASLNPVRTVGQTLAEPLRHHRLAKTRAEVRERSAELLSLVGMTPPEEYLGKYPFELSGGQRQRASIARALTVNPSFIVADEAVSMVDVSLRISLLNILLDLQRRLDVGFLMITHDLAVAKHFAWEGRIGVMYLGRLVELGPAPAVVSTPVHPYTKALLSALPEPDPRKARTEKKLLLRSLEVPSLTDLPAGCPFHPRCPQFEQGTCDAERPSLTPVGDQGHQAACTVMARRLVEH